MKIMTERSKADTVYDKGYKEAMEQNFGTVVKIESELQSENEDVEMHNGRRLSHAKYDHDKNKQDAFE